MRFLYFLPNPRVSPPTSEELPGLLAAAGLREVLRGLSVRARLCANGPGGTGGILLVDAAESDGSERYAPDLQVWALRPATAAAASRSVAWVGYWKAYRPQPDELLRSQAVPGHEVLLSDGRWWRVPIGRCMDGAPGLPQTYVLEAGGLRTEVTEDYAGLWADVLKIWTGAPMSEADIVGVAYRALAVNYHVGGPEINALRLFGPNTVGRAVEALLDYPTIAAVLAETEASKKAEAGEASPGTPAGSPGACGASEASPATLPASPICAGR